MTTPYYSDDRSTLYNADALAVLASLPAASVDALITDPPYSSGGMVRGDRTATGSHRKYSGTVTEAGLRAEFSGDSRDQWAYAYWCALWLSEAMRVTKPGGVAMIFTDWRQLPTTTDALQSEGWVWRGLVPWHKPHARPQVGRFTAACEYVVWGSNGPLPGADGVSILPGFYDFKPPRQGAREHATQKPLELMRAMCRIAPQEGLFLDPFAGSGTTGVGALLEGRRFVGVELTEHYSEVAANRLRTVERGYRDDGKQDALDFGGVA